MKSITLYDVADHAGISYQTASRVVDQASHVSAKTRQRVGIVMAELSYIPNRVVQQLAGRQMSLIGAVTANPALHAPLQTAAAIKPRADQSGASMVIAMVERSGVESCKAAAHNLLPQRVIGLTINYPLDEEDATAVAAACGTVPVLFLDVSDLTPTNGVIFSHDDGTRLDVEHLVWHGHQRIALLSGPHTSVSIRLRHVGWHKYLVYYQLQPVAELEGDWSATSGFQQTMYMLNNGNLLIAILVADDQTVLGAIWATSEFGLRVVVDILVIGYDDTEDSACYISPLITVRQDFPLLGETSADRLLQLSRSELTVGNQLLLITLVKRKTALSPDTQATIPQALADSPIQLARQVSQLTPKS